MSEDLRMQIAKVIEANCATIDSNGNVCENIVGETKAADAILSLPGWSELREALIDLAEAARNACDARLHTPLIDALAEADRLISITTKTGSG